MKKVKAIETMTDFPQEFELEDLLEKLVFIDKVEKARQQVKEGKTKTHQDVRDLRKKC